MDPLLIPPNTVFDPTFGEKPLLDLQLEAGLVGDFDLGWKIAQRLLELSPDCKRAAFNRAWYYMRDGDLLKGLESLDEGRWIHAFGSPPLPSTKLIYRDENLTGKHLLIYSEGGLGDEIVNARFARNFAKMGARVSMSCDPNLMSVFSRAPGVSSVVAHCAAPHIYHDFWVPGMSAARVLNTQFEDLIGTPYLSVDPAYQKKWQSYFSKKIPRSDGPRIGLKFYGNPKFEHEQHRRFPPEDLIAAVHPHSWVNLQLEETNLPIENWEDTLAIVEQLDLVITSCTSLAHASAALGKPTWILVPILPYYLWALPGSKSPWYESVTLIRQKTFGFWDNVFETLKEKIETTWKNQGYF